VGYLLDGTSHTITGSMILANVAPYVLEQLLGPHAIASGAEARPDLEKPEGAQVKVNLMLTRLPMLLDRSVDPAAAFGGTFHINESYSGLRAAFRSASGGTIPTPLPSEAYCHSLTDSSILSPELAATGAQTITVFALHAPDRLLTAENNDEMRQRYQRAVLDSIDSVLAEPIEPLLMTDASGRPCIETKTTLDLEAALHMPGGNIFHGPLSWPFLEDSASRRTPAERWGVATAHDRILLCGSGARRGGAVSGIGGHNAAMAVLEGD
jgi:phytoene dehydrogenase-like protein